MLRSCAPHVQIVCTSHSDHMHLTLRSCAPHAQIMCTSRSDRVHLTLRPCGSHAQTVYISRSGCVHLTLRSCAPHAPVVFEYFVFTGVSWKLCSHGVKLTQSVDVVIESCHNPGYIHVVCMNLPLQNIAFMKPHRIQSILMQL